MKKIINYKKIMLFAATLLLVLGCNINAIPTYVSKDVSLGLITVNNLQNTGNYVQELTIDLSNLISDDQFDAIETAKFKSASFTLNNDYKNTVTSSENLSSGVIIIYELKEGIPFTLDNVLANKFESILFVRSFIKGVPSSSIIGEGYDIKNLIKDKKIKVGIYISSTNLFPSSENFNDDAFSFTGKIETEVLVE